MCIVYNTLCEFAIVCGLFNFFFLFYCSHSPLIWFAISFHFILEVQVYRIRCIFPNLSFIHVWLPFCSHLHYIGYAFVVFISSFIFFSFSVILLPFSFAGLLFYGFGTYHLQLMHTICLLKRTQWFSNATNKDNNKCLLINTFSSTFQCFRSKTRLISNHCVFFRHKIYFIFDHFHYDFYWTTILYRQFLFGSVQFCTAMLLSYINIIK